MSTGFAVALGVLVILAAAGAYTDVRYRRLPNLLCLGLCIAGLVYAVAVQQRQIDVRTLAHGPSALSNLAHVALALGVGMALYALRWFGAGDAKFYAGLAAWLPLGKAVSFLVATSLAGVVLLLAWFSWRRLSGKRMVARRDDESGKFPYGVAIAVGAVMAFLP